MTLWLSRDFVQSNGSEGWPGIRYSNGGMYYTAIFLYRILGFTIVGRTNFAGIDGAWTLASGTASPNRAGINYGTGKEYEVGIPVGVHTVSATYINHILVLRSTANPTKNAGLFRITGVNVTNNRYIVDWRSTDFPPAEADDTFDWWLYEQDTTACNAITYGSAGSGGYRGGTTSTNSRVIFQSPHATAWQVRLCSEYDAQPSTCTMTIGYGGTAAGDWPIGGRHTHVGAFWNQTGTNDPYRGYGTGCGSNYVSRYTMLGDDSGQVFFCAIRDRVTPANWKYVLAGVADNEPTPLPADNLHRLFVIDTGGGSDGVTANGALWRFAGTITNGAAFGFLGVPCSAFWGAWAFSGDQNGPHAYGSAGNNPRTGATDLLPVQIMAGTAVNFTNQTVSIMQYEPRVMGYAPFLRQGRTNFGTFVATSDAGKAWIHLAGGVYMTYNGPTPISA